MFANKFTLSQIFIVQDVQGETLVGRSQVCVVMGRLFCNKEEQTVTQSHWIHMGRSRTMEIPPTTVDTASDVQI